MEVNIFSNNTTKDFIEEEVQQVSELYYNKQEVDEKLNSIYNFLEVLSETYNITLENDLQFNFKR